MVSEWREVLFRSLGGLSGVSLEDKGVSLAIHYRRAAEQDLAVAAIREAARGLENARLIAGKDVINLLPRGGPDKGVALARVKAQLGCTAALYVGDDATHEPAFALPHMLGGRVSPAAGPGGRGGVAGRGGAGRRATASATRTKWTICWTGWSRCARGANTGRKRCGAR